MQGFELNIFLDKFPLLKPHYLGIFAIDTLPKFIKLRQFLICNTDESTGSGLHWFSLLRNAKDTVECFDSLGVTTTKQETLRRYCNFRGITNLEFNENIFQSVNSNSCGQFTLYYIIQRMHNLDLSFEELLEEIFDDKDHKLNEEKVLKFYSNIVQNNSV